MLTVRCSSPMHAGIHRGGLPQCMPGYTGGCLPKGGSAPMHARIHSPPPPRWTEWLTERCKNISFPQLRCERYKLYRSCVSTKKLHIHPKICKSANRYETETKNPFLTEYCSVIRLLHHHIILGHCYNIVTSNRNLCPKYSPFLYLKNRIQDLKTAFDQIQQIFVLDLIRTDHFRLRLLRLMWIIPYKCIEPSVRSIAITYDNSWCE